MDDQSANGLTSSLFFSGTRGFQAWNPIPHSDSDNAEGLPRAIADTPMPASANISGSRHAECVDSPVSPTSWGEAKFDCRQLVPQLRFVEIADEGVVDRRGKIRGIFGDVQIHELSRRNLRALTLDSGTFAGVVCSVDDVWHLNAILSPPSDLLIKNKVAFAYSSKSDPDLRAVLLRVGFDDVLNSQMKRDEVFARVASMLARSEVYNSRGSFLTRDEWEAFLDAHVSATLTVAQERVLKALLAARAKPVSFAGLASFDLMGERYRVGSLKVIISNVRKKLRGCEIMAERGKGYTLIVY